MADFYANIPPDQAMDLNRLSRVSYALRDSRKAVLDHHGVADEAELLARIVSGSASEHPTWEHYLAARILADTREAARALLAERLAGAPRE